MSYGFQSEEYYKRFIELQEKLRKSEEERLKLEMKFNEMVQVTREEEQMHYRKLRTQYKRFLEEDRRRQDRNERILRTLERIESRVAMLVAKTERFKLLRQQYQTFLNRVCEMKKTEMSHVPPAPPPQPKENESAKPNPTQDTNNIVQTYLENLSSNKLKEMLKKEGGTMLPKSDQPYTFSDLYTFSNGESKPNRVNSIADDIMNSIHSKTNLWDKNKFRQPREFNNNISSPDNAFKIPKNDNYANILGTSSSVDFYTPTEQKSRETSAPEDTDTEDFSESEEILYKNPIKFNKEKIKEPDTYNLEQVESSRHQETYKVEIPPRRMEQQNPLVSGKTDNIRESDNHLLVANNKDLQENKHQDILELKQLDQASDSCTIKSKEKEATCDENNTHNFTTEKQAPVDEALLQTQQDKLQKEIHLLPEQKKDNLEDKIQSDPVQEQQSGKQCLDISQSVQEVKQERQGYEESQISQQYEESHQGDQQYDAASHQQYVERYEEGDSLNQQYQSEQISQPFDDGKEIVERYDEKRQSLQQYDENGQTLQRYDESGQPFQEYYENGQHLQNYNENDQPLQQYDQNGQPIQHYEENVQPLQGYDETGQPLEQYNESGQPLERYDESGQPVQRYDESDQPFQQYDENGQPLQQYDQGGQPVQQYDAHGQPTQQYDKTRQPLQQYDENGQPLQQYDGNGQPLQQYDENGQPLQQFDESGQSLQQYDNIPPQQFNENTDSVGQYDAQGQYAQQYDENGQPISQYGGMPESAQQYDEHGQLIQSYDQEYAGDGQFMQPYGENMQYDENGQLIQQYSEQEYNQHGQVIPQYDENGQLIEQYGQHIYDENQQALQQYDENGQLVHEYGAGEFETSQAQSYGDQQFPTESQADNQANVIESIPQESEKLEQNDNTVPGEHEEPKKASNVMEMLDTDTESTKQETKISHDSDFDFSNG